MNTKSACEKRFGQLPIAGNTLTMGYALHFVFGGFPETRLEQGYSAIMTAEQVQC